MGPPLPDYRYPVSALNLMYTPVMHNSDSGIGIDSGISQFFAGIGIGTGIKKTKRYWNRNRN